MQAVAMKVRRAHVSGMLRKCGSRVAAVAVLSCLFAHSSRAADKPLPTTFFKSIHAGKKQTVVVYGTSVSTVEKGAEWTSALDRFFKKEYPGKVTFINSASGGKQSIWGMEHLKERVLDHHPDLVFIEFAINDAATKHGISTEDCRDNLDAMVKALRAQNPRVDIVLQTMNPAWDSPDEVKNYAGDRPHLADYYEVYRRYAQEHHLPLVDHYPVWHKIMEEDPGRYHAMVPDGIHPTSEASQETTWPQVLALLNDARLAATPPTRANTAYGDHPRQVLDFWQAPSDQPAPVVLYMHGGGWRQGDKVDALRYAPQLLSAGISVVSINYRFTHQAAQAGVEPPVEWPMHDAARALQFIRSNAAEWNIDKVRIGATGNSAGACTVLWLAFHDDMADPDSADPIARESTRLWCVAASEGQTSLDPAQMKAWIPNSRYGSHAFGLMDTQNAEAENKAASFDAFLLQRESILPWIREYSPYGLASDDDPPVWMVYKNRPEMGQPQRDPTHSANFGLALKQHLDGLGVECELVYPGAEGVQHENRVDYLVDKLGMGASATGDGAINIVIIGDSTVSNYKEDSPKRGWGQMISGFFDDKVTIDNRALSGRSTKTFIEQGWWDKAMDILRPGDYVLIQFGHNDSHKPGKPESTDAFGSYQTYLQRYIEDVRSRGAIPVLVTPMHRRSFDEDGNLLSCRINDDGGRDGDLAPYAQAMKQVAVSNRVACVDLFAMSGQYMQRIGDEACKTLLAPDDRTHWNEKGARVMASLVVQGIRESDVDLKRYLRSLDKP